MNKIVGKGLFLLFALSMTLGAETLKLDNTMSVQLDIPQPIPAEKTAEEELNCYLQKIFGYY